MFRALLDHPQEALYKRHLVYCVRIMSAGCGMVAVSVENLLYGFLPMLCVMTSRADSAHYGSLVF
jgi:hypothetical protein